jgi:hypothetical protein
MQEHTNALEKEPAFAGLRVIPPGNEGSYPFDSCSLRLAINPVKGTRSPQPVENLMEHLLRRYLSQSNERQIQLPTENPFWEFEEVGDDQPPGSNPAQPDTPAKQSCQ